MTELCEVCKKTEKRYKCPKCLIVYCSVACWKTHVDTCQTILRNVTGDKDQMSEESKYCHVTENTVTINKLKLLDNCQELKDILKNPHVRNILLAIDKSKTPADDLERAMREPIFVEFVDACLKQIEPSNEQ